MAGKSENPLLWLRLIVLPNVAPALTLFLNSMSVIHIALSVPEHTTNTLLPVGGEGHITSNK